MQTMHITEKTGSDGTLTLRLALDRPDTEFEVVVVAQPKPTTKEMIRPHGADPWAGADAIRLRLAATGATSATVSKTSARTATDDRLRSRFQCGHQP